MISIGFAFTCLKYRFGKSSNYQQTQIARAENKVIWGSSKDQGLVKIKETSNCSALFSYEDGRIVSFEQMKEYM